MKIIEPSAKLVRGYEDKPEELIELCGRICYDSQDKIAPGTAQKFCEMLRKNGHTSVFEHANIILEVSRKVECELVWVARDYCIKTGLPSFLRFDRLDGINHRRHFVSGNVRAWNNMFNSLSAGSWIGFPECVLEALPVYPALFDTQRWKRKLRSSSGTKDFKATVVLPSRLPKWARERHTTATFFITCDRGISHELVRHRAASFSQQSTRYCKANKNGEIEVIAPHGHEEGWRVSLERNCFLSSCDELYNDALEHTGSPQIARSVLPTCLATRLYMTMTLERWRDFLKLRTSPAAHPDMRVIAEQIQRQLFPDEIGDSNADWKR